MPVSWATAAQCCFFAGAPDVAFTVVVETVFVIVVAAVLLALKRQGKAMSVPEPVWRPVMALVLSLAFATVLTPRCCWPPWRCPSATLSRWFGEHSVPAAQGRNVVNVILVDRALDTLGEITVVMLSLLAAVPLLRAVRTRRDTEAGR